VKINGHELNGAGPRPDFLEVYDYGKCFYCDNLGFHQVYRTEDNWVEIIMRGFVWVLIVAVVLLFIWVSYRH
jgi:hypothetical protein